MGSDQRHERSATGFGNRFGGRFERRIVGLALAGMVPALALAAILVLVEGIPRPLAWTALSAAIVGAAIAVLLLRRRLVYPLNTLANLLGSLRDEDFSLRARSSDGSGPMSQVQREVNALAATLHEQRLGAQEATVLLRKVLDALDVAVFTVDDENRLDLANRAGARLLNRPRERLIGASAEEVGLEPFLDGPAERLIDRSFPGRTARWDIRRRSLRHEGVPSRLLVLSDLSRPLREEERQAWKRLIRVLGHELNNSLAPIQSMAATLADLLEREPPPVDWQEDARDGLRVIEDRSKALARFTRESSRLARLPEPRLEAVDLGLLVNRVAALDPRLPVAVDDGPQVVIELDAGQIEGALINLLKNAVDAALETGGGVRVTWRSEQNENAEPSTHHGAEITIEDDGPGLANPDNLFVPFYTTKDGGSGIGLVLARQIAEAHGGSVSLENRPDSGGCIARLRLPGRGLVSGS